MRRVSRDEDRVASACPPYVPRLRPDGPPVDVEPNVPLRHDLTGG